MEELEQRRLDRRRLASFAAVVVLLLVMIAALGWLFHVTVRLPGDVDAHRRDSLARLAWVSLVLLGMAVLMLFWTVARYVKFLLAHDRERGEPTTYVDAWSEAGKRVKLDDQEEAEDES